MPVEDRAHAEFAVIKQELTKLGLSIELFAAKQDGMGQLIDERWKSMEQRLDITARQTQQSIELVTSTLTKLESSHKESDAEIDKLQTDVRVHQVEFEDLRRSVDDQRENLRWIWRALFGGALGLGTTIIAFFITQHPFTH